MTKIDIAVEGLSTACMTLKNQIDESLRKYPPRKKNDLEFFLFNTLLGQAFRRKIFEYLYKRALNEQDLSSTLFKLLCNSHEEALRVQSMIQDLPFLSLVKEEFSIFLERVAVEGDAVKIVMI